MDHVVELHAPDDEEEEEAEERQPVSHKEVIELIERLQFYEGSQEDPYRDCIRTLEGLSRSYYRAGIKQKASVNSRLFLSYSLIGLIFYSTE